jgi:hypothetical protein
MPSIFFEVSMIGDEELRNKISSNNFDLTTLTPFLSKWNQFFNKIKFPYGRYIRIFVSNENIPLTIDDPIKGIYWAINVGYTNYKISSLFEISNDQKKEAIIKTMYDASKLVFAKYSLDFDEMEQCFEQLWDSDYITYHKRVSKIYSSPLKTHKVYLWHEIELGNTDIYLICENKTTKEQTKSLVYFGEGYSDHCFSYLTYNPTWISEDLFSLSNETGEVIHIFDLVNHTFDVKYKPMQGWSEEYLRLKLEYLTSNDKTEKNRINKEIDLEFKKMQEQVWLSGKGKY